MIRSLIQMTALILTLGASIFLLKSNLNLTPDTIAKISSTHYRYSKPVVESFSEQSANTRIGIILLFGGFILQLINSLWPMRWKDFGVNWYGIFISIGVSIILLAVAQWYSKELSEKIARNTIQIFEEKQ